MVLRDDAKLLSFSVAGEGGGHYEGGDRVTMITRPRKSGLCSSWINGVAGLGRAESVPW